MSGPVAHGLRRAARTLLQLVAGGALTAVVSAAAGGLAPSVEAIVMAAWTAVVAGAQNTLEAKGTIPTLLPSVPVAVSPPASSGPA